LEYARRLDDAGWHVFQNGASVVNLSNGESRSAPLPREFVDVMIAQARDTEHVLDVACGTGYSSAVLARLAGSVIALEEDAELARQAKEALASTRAERVTLALGPLTAGWPTAAPYDVILINGAIEVISPALAHQLKPDGRLACVYGRPPAGKAMIYRMIEGRPVGRPAFDAAAPLLPDFVAPPAFVF